MLPRSTAYTGNRYSLKWNSGSKITTSKYALYAVQLAALIVISWLSTVSSFVVGPGIGLYWATIFLVLFTLWWGAWGLLGVYVGSVIGGGLLTGAPLLQALVVNFGANLIPVLLIFLLYRGFLARRGVDPFCKDVLSSRKSLAWYVFWIMLVTNAVGGVLGVWGLVLFGVIPAAAFIPATVVWIAGNFIVLILLPFISRYITPILERYGLLVRGWIA